MPELVDKTCRRTDYCTPRHVLEAVREYFLLVHGRREIGLDPATTDANPTDAREFFTERTNGLHRTWTLRGGVFVNPPFGIELAKWCVKIAIEAKLGAHIVALLPGNRFETEYLQEHILAPELEAVCFVRRRLRFVDECGEPLRRADGKPGNAGNPYGSVIYLYNGDRWRFARVFKGFGRIYSMKELVG